MMPSPTNTTRCPSLRSRSTSSTFPLGYTSASTRGMSTDDAMASAVVRRSPVTSATPNPMGRGRGRERSPRAHARCDVRHHPAERSRRADAGRREPVPHAGEKIAQGQSSGQQDQHLVAQGSRCDPAYDRQFAPGREPDDVLGSDRYVIDDDTSRLGAGFGRLSHDVVEGRGGNLCKARDLVEKSDQPDAQGVLALCLKWNANRGQSGVPLVSRTPMKADSPSSEVAEGKERP